LHPLTSLSNQTCLYFNVVESPCPILSPPDNGHLEVSGKGYGAVATYFCNSGFKLDGYPQIRCTIDGRWSNTVPNCTSSGET